MIWILIGVYLLIIYLEVPSLVKNHLYRELGVFIVVFSIGLYMSLAQFYGWPLYNPFTPWI